MRLSLVIPVGPHDEATLERLLDSIGRQSFPKTELEVLLQYQGHSEEARAAGIRRAQGEIIGCLDADNQLLGHEFLQRLYDAACDPAVVGAYPSHYAWFADDAPLNRYFALLGANDPLAWWLGKADRHSYLHRGNQTCGVQRFDGSIPTLGSNGFFVKRALAQPFADAWAQSHIDGCEAMRQAGFDTYTVVDAVIWHHTGTSLVAWLRKRYRYARQFGLSQRRLWQLVHTPGDWLKVVAFAAASLCVLPHLWVSVVGARRVRDRSWALHPFVCLCLTCVYSVALLSLAWSFVPRGLRAMRRSWRHWPTNRR